MFSCDRCAGDFGSFATPGKCPLCDQWVTIECTGCAHSAPAIRFISAGHKCPKCGRDAKVPGRNKTSILLLVGLVAVVVSFILLVYFFATIKMKPRKQPMEIIPHSIKG